MRFKNREEAGKLLAKELMKLPRINENTVILSIPRGGVPVAYSLSKETGIPFSMIITKKITPLNEPEAAIGAIAPDGSYILSPYSFISDYELEKAKEKALKEAIEKKNKYLGGKDINIKGKNVIIVDDGIATGYTAMAAGIYAKNKGAEKVILAVPVCPKDSKKRLYEVFDEVICFHEDSSPFFAVGMFYEDFHQISDEEMYDYLNRARVEKILYSEED
ncbi:phosphoribosyltransferase [Persephonella sp.]